MINSDHETGSCTKYLRSIFSVSVFFFFVEVINNHFYIERKFVKDQFVLVMKILVLRCSQFLVLLL